MRKRVQVILVCIVLLIVVGIGFLIKTRFQPGGKEVTGNQLDNDENEFYVTFLSSDGTVLKVDAVGMGESAIPPVAPVMPYGYAFSYWDGDYTNITKDTKVQAVCTKIPTEGNVFVLENSIVSINEEVKVPMRLSGEVCIAGFELIISYDSEFLEYVGTTYEDEGVLTNASTEKNEIYLNYLSTNNTEAEVDLCDFVFKALKPVSATNIEIAIKTAVAVDEQDEFYTPECEVLNAIIAINE